MSIDARLRTALALLALALPAAAQDKPKDKPGHAAPARPGRRKGARRAVAKKDAASPGDAAIVAAQFPTYPMNSCVACGKIWDRGTRRSTFVRQGRLVACATRAAVKPFDDQAANGTRCSTTRSSRRRRRPTR